ncbi:MAG TPA: hypothetical protein VEO01_16715 [Pseudonocardiaceae bacterium]|nr:hypothetical protein [Pseudonocardiaceae bacterium]
MRLGRGRGRDGDRVRTQREAAQAAPVLSDPTAALIFVEHRDRLARFGVVAVVTGEAAE